MNYRHHYHAGNFADCMKHALFVALLRAMLRKEKPFLVLDTHAGTGFYDLDAEPALRTGESRSGIERVIGCEAPALGDYLRLVRQIQGSSAKLYPGSPALARALLRPGDRLALSELHDEDAATLRRAFRRDKQVQVHHRDGYEALRALVPPAEKRGLILIDPPFERVDEFAVLAAALEAAVLKFPSGVYAAWYPVKHRPPVRAFFDDLAARGMRDIIVAELLRHPPIDPSRLNGCGLLVINPPYRFAEASGAILETLAACLGFEDGGVSVTRIADE